MRNDPTVSETRSKCYYFLDSYLQQSNIALEKHMTSSVSLYRVSSSFDSYYTRTLGGTLHYTLCEHVR
jgi:hypothetical protein